MSRGVSKIGHCTECYLGQEDLRVVRCTPMIGHWTGPRLMCRLCRQVIYPGRFRYSSARKYRGKGPGPGKVVQDGVQLAYIVRDHRGRKGGWAVAQ